MGKQDYELMAEISKIALINKENYQVIQGLKLLANEYDLEFKDDDRDQCLRIIAKIEKAMKRG